MSAYEQQLLVETSDDAIALHPPIELQSMDDGETTENTCPDRDSLLEKFYDGYGNPKYFCDNCGVLEQGSTAIALSDMDITQDGKS